MASSKRGATHEDRSPRSSYPQDLRLSSVALATLIAATAALTVASCDEPLSLHEAGTAAEAPMAAAALAALAQPASTVRAQALPEELVAALDVPSELRPVVQSFVTPDPTAAFVAPSFGAIQPRRGSSLVVLSTGRSGDGSVFAEPGTDFAPAGPAGDVVTLRFQVVVPPEQTHLSFRYQLLSAEAPEFIGAGSNDTFSARVTDAQGTRLIASTSVDSAVFSPVSPASIGETPFSLYIDDPSGVDTFVPGQVGRSSDAGIAEWQLVSAAVSSGLVTIELDIRDVGTGLLDSAVVLDGFSFSAVAVVDPHDDLIDDAGRVVRDPALLASGGRAVDAAAADGITQVLVRVAMSGPGSATLTLASGMGGDGALSEPGPSPVWSSSVTVSALQVGSSYHAFFLYRSPAAFNRGGDALSRRRAASLTLTYSTLLGHQYSEAVSIGVERPPVVAIPETWISCLTWMETHGGLLLRFVPEGDPRNVLTGSCIDYPARKGISAAENQDIVHSAILSALAQLRDTGVAATQVDVVAHGMGGLLARLVLSAPGFVHATNFNAGAIHRLITMNTPHLGARLATEIVRTRQFAKQRGVWELMTDILEAAGVFIDDVEGDLVVDDLRPDSAIIDSLRGGVVGLEPVVSYHALVSTGGRAIARAQALGLLPSSARILYSHMESYDPIVWSLPVPQRQRLIFGPQSRIFCADGVATPDDDHDLFATVWEQKGGLEAPYVTQFLVSATNGVSGHFLVVADQAHTDRVVALLNEPANSPLFASSMPWPRNVPRRNSCPLPPL